MGLLALNLPLRLRRPNGSNQILVLFLCEFLVEFGARIRLENLVSFAVRLAQPVIGICFPLPEPLLLLEASLCCKRLSLRHTKFVRGRGNKFAQRETDFPPDYARPKGILKHSGPVERGTRSSPKVPECGCPDNSL